MPQNILIIGATRGLGDSLANAYASQTDTTVFGTTRSAAAPKGLDEDIVWIPYIGVSESSVGAKLVNILGLPGGGGGMTEGEVTAFDIVVCRPCDLGRSQI
jgi:NAD(P)-dependent dehydrogenase (short-subunit alcohol dehydrogenase family)